MPIQTLPSMSLRAKEGLKILENANDFVYLQDFAKKLGMQESNAKRIINEISLYYNLERLKDGHRVQYRLVSHSSHITILARTDTMILSPDFRRRSSTYEIEAEKDTTYSANISSISESLEDNSLERLSLDSIPANLNDLRQTFKDSRRQTFEIQLLKGTHLLEKSVRYKPEIAFELIYNYDIPQATIHIKSTLRNKKIIVFIRNKTYKAPKNFTKKLSRVRKGETIIFGILPKTA
jgi:hypothetical protein